MFECMFWVGVVRLYSVVKKNKEASKPVEVDKLKVAHNNLIQTLSNVKIADRISTKRLLEEQQML